MDYVRFQHLFHKEGVRLAESAATGLDTPVPSCPGWTVADLVGHTGSVYLTAAEWLKAGHRPEPNQGAPAPKNDVLAWYGEALTALRAELARRDPLTPGFEDDGDGAVGFWYRRLAHEAAMHRTDVEMALGTPGPIDLDLAVDGIDEALRVLLPLRYDAAGPDAAVGRTVGVHCHQHDWRLTLHRDAVEVSRSPGFTDASVRGEPGDLLLYLWGRRPGTVVSRTGDTTVLAAFRRRLALSMV
ncbi:maleylpyruvate isomerase family mycothiol-dependent enzyme [Yinghuangia soli]|uniref:Maleylpyruvate isomerase family mycothiol-dependent enzyme n=1 Tax=Yinghuangia soli TaxID=2908204 RepID=A0AA41U1B0_9ACTN|nr:maleylpyruvate isomerase family mycothiol-dependent enzyme [Yinghuangia soli]MCF2529441.1 maleylpyruvate isomerase family mycothiol-dependent enzyme [Yinghuangia soli]